MSRPTKSRKYLLPLTADGGADRLNRGKEGKVCNELELGVAGVYGAGEVYRTDIEAHLARKRIGKIKKKMSEAGLCEKVNNYESIKFCTHVHKSLLKDIKLNQSWHKATFIEHLSYFHSPLL